MNRICAALICVVVGILTLTACQVSQAPAAGMGDPWPTPINDPQITVIPPELRAWLGFQPAIVTRDPNLAVEIPMRNLSERLYLLDYRIIFYDEVGREQSPVMDWTQVALRSKQVARLKANAYDDRAETWKVEVKWAR